MRKPILALLFLFALSSGIFARHPNSGWIHSYTAETADKKHIFVMRDDRRSDYFVGDRYPHSGMYPNDGSSAPLWTIDWKERVYLPNGGKHVVRLGRLGYSATYRETAFTFVAAGKELKTYRTRDLIAFPWLLPHSSAGYAINYSGGLDPDFKHDGAAMKVDHGGSAYPINSGAFFDHENRTMRIETFHGDRFLFDLTTGNVISAERPSRSLALVLFGALLIAYAAYVSCASRAKLSRAVSMLADGAVAIAATLFLFLIPVFSILPYKIPLSAYDPDYPNFRVCCIMSVSMLPETLLTSLDLISPPTSGFPDVAYETAFW